MNIFDLKRQLWAMQGVLMPSESDGGNGNTGTSGATGAARGGYGGGGGGGLGLGNYGGLADGYTGYSPTTGYASTQTSAPGPSTYGYSPSTAGQDTPNVGVYGQAWSRSRNALGRAADATDKNWATRMASGLTGAGIRGLADGVGLGWSNDGPDPRGETSDTSGYAGYGGQSAPDGDYRGEDSGIASTSGTSGSTTTASSTAPSVADAIAGTLNLSDTSSGWGDYVKNTLPNLQSQVSQATDRGNAAYDTAQNQSDSSLGMANQMNQDYNSIYRPFGQKMADEVNNMGSADYQAQQRGLATANVQQQSDAQMQSQQRNLQRMGVNPSSGRMLAMGNANAINTAAAKAGAAQQSDASVKSNYLQGLNSMNNFGNQLQTQARANSSQGMDWSKYGLSSGLTGLGANMDLSKLTTNTAGTYGGLANQKTAAANGVNLANQQQSNYENNRNWEIGGAILGGLASFF